MSAELALLFLRREPRGRQRANALGTPSYRCNCETTLSELSPFECGGSAATGHLSTPSARMCIVYYHSYIIVFL